MNFYTADCHFFHRAILEYENRPFPSVDEMNEEMIKKWNKKVKAKDAVYILGDFSFGKPELTEALLDRLNGKKYLIIGNHDYFAHHKNFDKTKFEWIKAYHTLSENVSGETYHVILFHYPIAAWERSHYGSIHLYGHLHSNEGSHRRLDFELKNAFNVGVDVRNFEPVSLKEILNKS